MPLITEFVHRISHNIVYGCCMFKDRSEVCPDSLFAADKFPENGSFSPHIGPELIILKEMGYLLV